LDAKSTGINHFHKFSNPYLVDIEKPDFHVAIYYSIAADNVF